MKHARMIVLALLLCTAITILTGCSTKLSGTYVNRDLIEQSITFADDQASLSAFGLSITGNYVIEEEELVITYSLGNLSYDWRQSFRKDGDTIYIDEVPFVKEK